MTLSLPMYVTSENKIKSGWILTFVMLAMYVSSNRVHLFEPAMLPMWWIDRVTPLVPDTIWIYLSEYALFPLAFLQLKDRKSMNLFCYCLLVLQTFSVLIFWFFPTTYPRDLYPLTGNENMFTYWVFSTFRSLDTPANCLPSLHVGSCYITSFVFLQDPSPAARKKFWAFFLWATAVAITTLTTKQHYIVDCFAGLGCAAAVYWLLTRKVTYYIPGAQANR
ncbi:MAG: phosphatase PAP2 family protein [Bacteriovoracia bacterium]